MRTRLPKLNWAAAICVVVFAAGLAVALLRPVPGFKSPGPKAKVCYAVSRWAESLKFTDIAARLSRFATTLEARRVQAAVQSGRLTVVKFDTPDPKESAEVLRRASDLGK